MGIANAITTIINLIIVELQAPVAIVLGLIIIINGYKLLTGSPQTVDKAKTALIISLIGLVLVLFGPAIAEKVKEIISTNVTIYIPIISPVYGLGFVI